MAVKTTGVEFKRFYSDAKYWPVGSWHEEETVLVDDCEIEDSYDTIPDSSKVTVDGGIVFGQVDEPSLETHFKRWRKEQMTSVFIVEAPIDKVDAVKAAIKAAGGKL